MRGGIVGLSCLLAGVVLILIWAAAQVVKTMLLIASGLS